MKSRRSDTHERIISLAPSATSILFAIGANRNLVGVSKWCDAVAPVGRLPRLGDCWSLIVEEVAKLRPTLILGSVPYKAETVAHILELRAPFVAMNPSSLADVYADIRMLGHLTERSAAAESVVRNMEESFRELKRHSARARKRPRVYCEAWPNPRITSPPWVAELVEIAGGKSVVAAGQKVSDEAVAREDPEVIVLAWTATGERGQPKSALENPSWQDISAVRHNQVYVVRDELLNTPAPVLVRGAEELLRILHPELASQSPRNRGKRG